MSKLPTNPLSQSIRIKLAQKLREPFVPDSVSDSQRRSLFVWDSRWTQLTIAGMLLCGSSCSTASKYVKDTFHPDPQSAAIAQEEKKEADVKHAYTASKKEGQKVEPLAHSAGENAAKAKLGESQPVETKTAEAGAAALKTSEPRVAESKAGSEQEILKKIARGVDPFADSAIQQVSSELPGTAEKPAAPDDNAIHHADVPRTPVNPQLASAEACPPIPTDCPSAAPCGARPFPGAEKNTDEFVCDGGDKGTPVHYQGLDRAGLDVEDTIAEYRDETGKVRMTPSTQACVYAPRFGSVSSSTLPELGQSVDKVAGHQDLARVGGMETKTVIDEKTQTDEAQGVAMRARASGLDAKLAETQVQQAQTSVNHVTLANAYEDFKFIQEGQFDRASKAVIADSINAALEWSDGRRPIIVAKDSSGQIVQGRFTAQDYTGVEDKRTPGELKLVKVADKGSAHPGDIVTFTIRFDNVGGRDLTSIRIVDNLSPRLEFIEDSIQSDRNGKLDTTENGFGSKLLTFEFEEPLKGKTGGFISFKCRVR